MAQKTGPNQSIAWGWDYRESGWKTGMDANLVKIDTVLQLAVISDTVTAPPGGPSDGDRYIIPAGATGDWSGKTNQVAAWLTDVAAWTYYVPKSGWNAYVVSKKAEFIFDGSNWVLPGAWTMPYIFGGGLAYLWYDDTAGFLRVKAGSAPASISDGAAILTG